MDVNEAAQVFREFVSVIKALRTPDTGCPWDLEQDHQTLRPYLIEEVYEVLDAIDQGDDPAFKDELGDLLLQVVLHAQVADDRRAFCVTDVVRGITEKMVRRHPHVFGEVQVSGSDEVLKNWEQIKSTETQAKGKQSTTAARLSQLPHGLPALLRAQRVAEKLAKLASSTSSLDDLLANVRQAFAGLEEKIAESRCESAPKYSQEGRAPVEEAMGNVIFNLCQLASGLDLNTEDSLRSWTQRFIERFARRETQDKRESEEATNH